MTTNEPDPREAAAEAERALYEAKRKHAWGSWLADEWRKAREDNNFRNMVRDLAHRSP